MKKYTKKTKFLLLFLVFSLTVIPFLGSTVSSSAEIDTSFTLTFPRLDCFNSSNNTRYYNTSDFSFTFSRASDNSYTILLRYPLLTSYSTVVLNPYSIEGIFSTSTIMSYTSYNSSSSVNIGVNLSCICTTAPIFYTLSSFTVYVDNGTRFCCQIDGFNSSGDARRMILYISFSGSYSVNYPPDTTIFTQSLDSLQGDNISSITTADIYRQAYSEGYSEGKTQGLSDGYINGYNSGFAEGQIYGASLANDYSFGALLDAVFYAPLKYLYSLLNFDVLGINLYPVFISFLVLALAVTVLRIIF